MHTDALTIVYSKFCVVPPDFIVTTPCVFVFVQETAHLCGEFNQNCFKPFWDIIG